MDLVELQSYAIVRATQTYREIDDKGLREPIYGPDSRIGNAAIVKPEPCTHGTMHKLAGQSPKTVSSTNS